MRAFPVDGRLVVEGIGFSIELKAFPVDGRLVVLPPDSDDGRSSK